MENSHLRLPFNQIFVIYEDSDILVIEKPCGVSVMEEREEGPKINSCKLTVLEWVKNKLGKQSLYDNKNDEFEQRSGIVHRIDKETSGVLVIAKNKKSFDYLKGIFKFRRVFKQYQALVYGLIKETDFEVYAPLGRGKVFSTSYNVDPEGREALTIFKVISRYQPYTLMSNKSGKVLKVATTYLNAFPKTGRTHQIRVHLKSLGHPIVNDHKYASKELLERSYKVFDRMMLHAKSISFIDWEGKKRVFESTINLNDFFTHTSSQK